MIFSRVFSLLSSGPWFITSDGFDHLVSTFSAILDRRASRDAGEDAEFLSTADFATPPLHAGGVDEAGVGHFVADGVFAPRLSRIEKSCGGVDSYSARTDVESLIKSGAKSVMFHVNSPGGSGAYVPEFAEYVANLAVPTASYCYGCEASAATWAFSGVGIKGATPSARVGNIGGFIPFIDRSVAMQQRGLKWDPVVSTGADLKLSGGQPSLSDEERAHLQHDLDSQVRLFHSAVVKGRSKVGARPDMSVLGRGGVYRSREAASMGLLDFVGEYSDVYDTLVSRMRRR